MNKRLFQPDPLARPICLIRLVRVVRVVRFAALARVVLGTLLAGSLPAWAETVPSTPAPTPAPVPTAPAPATQAKGDSFNLAARKQQQPWLWQTPGRQKVPAVHDAHWPLSPEDRFVLHRLEAAGLQPAPDTDDRTWLRRVHFVITGLPPRPDEIKAFLDDRAPHARERVVDRLLASPHFGERWARHWMDLTRYAETRGHESDYAIANAWRYRDYLIRAFNADVPYNQFLSEHVAGDLLSPPRLLPGTDINESVIATGWAFLGEENHSPVDIRQDECERIDNKVDVFSKTFLGLTVSCARCHDHKFDPISAQDYYALTGFMLSSSFRQVRFESMENNRRCADELAALRAEHLPELAAAVARDREPGLRQLAATLLDARTLALAATLAPPATPATPAAPASSVNAQNARRDPDARPAAWSQHLREAVTNQSNPFHRFAQLALAPDASTPGRFLELLTTRRSSADATADTFKPGTKANASDNAKANASADADADTRVIVDFTQAASGPEAPPWKVDGEAFGRRPLSVGDLITGTNASQPIVRVMTFGAARRDLFWNRLRTAPDNQNDSGRLGATARAGQMFRTPTVTLGSGMLHYLLRGRTRVNASVDSHLMNEGPLHARLIETFDTGQDPGPRWVTHDLSAYSGHRVHVEFGPDGPGELEILMVVEAANRPRWLPPAGVVEPSPAARSLEDFARELQQAALLANRQLSRGTLFQPGPARRPSAGSPTVATLASLANWLVQHPALLADSGHSGASGADTCRLAEGFLARENDVARRVRWESHTAVAWLDGTGVDENILVRGKPLKPGALAPRSLPSAFASAKPIVAPTSSGRLELARQLVDPENPLVARVFVNRAWHHVFGRGIVPTVDNFGALGERPSHPELLDHLAWQFVHEDGWSLKRLIRRLVLTRTFAQSSRLADARTEELDPANALLHRMSVRRLEGEIIRDALLTVSGRLNPTIGGPPVTVHLNEFLVGRGRPEQSGPLDGDGRRSVYIAMRRNFLPMLAQTFDAPTPFSTVGRRNVTNVPGQSLALMNDPLFHQQARVWAERLLTATPGADEATRIRWLFESAYGRLPDNAEQRACTESLADLRTLHPEVGPQDVEVWSDLGHALLNANEFIYVP